MDNLREIIQRTLDDKLYADVDYNSITVCGEYFKKIK